jgi:acyl-coenzyme A synthetase/AMP-(fatty) acid ligase
MFLGRKDFQIKHLGYRIEMGEIEHAVLQVEGIRNCCVVYHHGRKEITLFYESDQDLSSAAIRVRLGAFLPKYMLPTVFRRMELLPRNPNGKIDRNNLAEMIATDKV